MPFPDIPKLRDVFIEQDIMLCFNGIFTATLIDEIGKALRNHMRDNEESPSAITDVFSVYIELTQNIRHYTVSRALRDEKAISTIVVSRTQDGRYTVSAGNMVLREDLDKLQTHITRLNAMDKTELKALFKTQLRKPKEDLNENNGAGLGLIDMARKAVEPLHTHVQAIDDHYAFFSLRVIL